MGGCVAAFARWDSVAGRGLQAAPTPPDRPSGDPAGLGKRRLTPAHRLRPKWARLFGSPMRRPSPPTPIQVLDAICKRRRACASGAAIGGRHDRTKRRMPVGPRCRRPFASYVRSEVYRAPRKRRSGIATTGLLGLFFGLPLDAPGHGTDEFRSPARALNPGMTSSSHAAPRDRTGDADIRGAPRAPGGGFRMRRLRPLPFVEAAGPVIMAETGGKTRLAIRAIARPAPAAQAFVKAG